MEEKYLPELMAEKDSLDPSFTHALRLVNQEIEKFQKGEGKDEEKYIDVVINKNMKLGQKVLIPVKQFPKFNFVGKLLGPRGNSLKRLQEETLTKMSILGKGSMRDKAKEEELRKSGEAKYFHLNDDLHVLIEVFAPPAEAYARMGHALEEIKKFLIPDYNDEIRQAQLQELTYLNGGSENADVPVVRGKPTLRTRGVPTPAITSYVFTIPIKLKKKERTDVQAAISAARFSLFAGRYPQETALRSLWGYVFLSTDEPVRPESQCWNLWNIDFHEVLVHVNTGMLENTVQIANVTLLLAGAGEESQPGRWESGYHGGRRLPGASSPPEGQLKSAVTGAYLLGVPVASWLDWVLGVRDESCAPSHSAERAHWELSELDMVLFTSLLTKLAVGPQTHPQGLSFVRVAETVVKGSKCEIPLRYPLNNPYSHPLHQGADSGFPRGTRMSFQEQMRVEALKEDGAFIGIFNQDYDDGYGTAYDEQSYDSYDNSYSAPTQSGADYYDYGHGLSEETYDSYGSNYRDQLY
ncbi:hypothetical protein MJG53_009346 [Ovis ammon polii x Ovis aries]|uniref:Uncharacterized protein n=1 Tax=Ovis ammon polii x Ovis aries TaxID=2918886 RepID=A0ACB9UW25_9CETA|nr:hypothetical protein MJG53_009346 [Ovis ammon polii x Ovis aries]